VSPEKIALWNIKKSKQAQSVAFGIEPPIIARWLGSVKVLATATREQPRVQFWWVDNGTISYMSELSVDLQSIDAMDAMVANEQELQLMVVSGTLVLEGTVAIQTIQPSRSLGPSSETNGP
jgi:hypothetical protein